MNEEIIYVESQGEIYRDDAALERLVNNSDARYADAHGEVLAVDDARWQRAQLYERSTWMEYNQNAQADRNSTHADGFGGYADLPRELGNVVELGCGVFTNLQYILQGREANSVALVDPLIGIYQSHKHCTFKNGVLQTRGIETFPVELVGSTIEDWLPQRQFDCVVMVNVLHHCRDAQAVFAKIRTLLKPGGYLVFHEPPREIDPEKHYDAGHPLAPHAETIEAFLSDGFIEVYRKGWYFIGRLIGTGREMEKMLEAIDMTGTTIPEYPAPAEIIPPPPPPVKQKTSTRARAKRTAKK